MIKSIRLDRYTLLALVMLGLLSLFVVNQPWQSDFWEHSSVVHELANHPLHPQHPQLNINAPSVNYSPYLWGLAMVKRLTGISALIVLSIGGIFNAIGLFITFPLFVSVFQPEHQRAVRFYFLLIVLLLWGTSPWHYSGFYHIGVIGYILPYPSTFTLSISFLSLWLFHRYIKSDRIVNLLLSIGLMALALVSHSITFLFAATGILSLAWSQPYRTKYISAAVMVLGGALLLALLWPLYPVWSLLAQGGSEVFHATNTEMYRHIFSRTFPVILIGFPLALLHLKSDRQDPGILMLAIFSIIYIAGALSGKYTFGRVISYMVMILQLFIAQFLSNVEDTLTQGERIKKMIFSIIVIVGLVFLSYSPVNQFILRTKHHTHQTLDNIQFLQQMLCERDVVIADLSSIWKVPTFGGKATATPFPIAFVNDQEQRREDVKRFFDTKTSDQERRQIINTYQANHILMRKQALSTWPTLLKALNRIGHIIYENDLFILMKIDSKASIPKEDIKVSGRLR